MRLLAITHQMLFAGKYHVSKIIIFVDEEINLLPYFIYFLTKISQLLHGTILPFHFLFNSRGKKMRIYAAERAKRYIAMSIQPLLIIIQPSTDFGKVQVDNEIFVTLWCRILTDIKLTEYVFEIIFLVDVVVIFEHREGKALAETARAYKEEILICIFYIFDERSLVNIVTILFYHIFKILHAIRNALAINPLFSFSYCHSLNSLL